MNKEFKVILISSIGGIFEFYDFIIFLLFAKIISKIFFPVSAGEHLSLMATYVIFAIGYILRPVGGIIFAHFGDRYGRKRIFQLTIFLMAIPTFLIGIIPAYNLIGIIAPILLLIMRVCQGLAVSGEIPASVTFVYEHISPEKKKLGMSVMYSGIVGGILLGSLVGVLTTFFFSAVGMEKVGWRIPFLLGGYWE